MKRLLLCLLAVLLLVQAGCDEAEETGTAIWQNQPDICHRVPVVYGRSGSGQYDLMAFRFGEGENVLLMTFAVHGYEDRYPRDGMELTELANRLIKRWDENPPEGWTVYVVPCANPDGLYLGKSNNGPGRCTVTSDSGAGMDINCCFPYSFRAYDHARNYNGDAPLQCAEARALAALAESIRGEGLNISVDVHGWCGQILTTGGKNRLFDAFAAEFPDNDYESLENGFGYFSAWCGYELGYEACLLELPPEDDYLTPLGNAVDTIFRFA